MDKRRNGIKAIDKKITDKTITKYGFELGEQHGTVDQRDSSISVVHYVNYECGILFINKVATDKFKDGYRSRLTIREFLNQFTDKLNKETLDLLNE